MDINSELMDFFKRNIRFTSKQKLSDLNKKYPNLKEIYEEFLKSDRFKRIINIIKSKNDNENLKLFFKHAKNFLNLYL